MILDKFNEFSDAQEPVASGEQFSTSVIDLGSAGDAESRRMRLHIKILEAFAGTGTTLEFELQTSITEAFDAVIVLWNSTAIAKATLVAGYAVTGAAGLVMPSGCKQYLRLSYTADDTFETTGILDAFLTNDADTNEF